MVRDFHPTYWLGTIPRGGLSAQRLEAISFWCSISHRTRQHKTGVPASYVHRPEKQDAYSISSMVQYAKTHTASEESHGL